MADANGRRKKAEALRESEGLARNFGQHLGQHLGQYVERE